MQRKLELVLALCAAVWTPRIDAQIPPPPPPPRRITKASDVFFTGSTRDERGLLNSRNPGYIIARDIDIAGWVVKTFRNVEDWHYAIVVDPDFIAARYGVPNSVLANAMLPGHIEDVPLIPREVPLIGAKEDPVVDPARRLPFADLATNGANRGVTINSFLLAHFPYVVVELNKWYVNNTQQGSYPFKGRGSAPSGWINDYVEPWMDPNSWWAFDPQKPDGTPLNNGDYVIVHGT